MDNFISKIAKHKKNYHGPKMRQQRLRMRRALQKQRQRIKNLVDDMHKKLCRELINEYDVILLPEFRTSEMVLRATRKIDNKTARNMLTLKHYQFRQRLLNLSAHPSCQTRVHICTEEYTTQTCGHCGWQHANIGGNKRFNCSHCNLRADRDHNAARNIYLLNAPKYVTNLQIPKPLVPLRSS
jgi:putative transposase